MIDLSENLFYDGHMQRRARILVALKSEYREMLFHPSDWGRLEALGEVSLIEDDATTLPDRACDDFDVMITGWGTPKLESVDGDRLRLIAHTSGSWRGALAPEVFQSDCVVTQAGSDPMARAVAEFALTMELAMLRELVTYDRGLWATRDYAASRQPAFGKAIHTAKHGLVGLSRVGVWHARMLRGLGVEDIVAYDPYWTDERAEALGVRLVELDEAMACDVVALHAPVTPETREMIGARELALIPDGALLLNTARSAIVDSDALVRELESGRIRAALDVFDVEPLPADSPLHGLLNVLLTPHVAGATVEARHEQGRTAVDEIERHLAGQPLQFAVAADQVAYLS